MNKAIDITIKLGVIITLIVAASTNQQYSYYQFVRWAIMVTSLYFAYKALISNSIGLLIFFMSVSIIFNSFKPIQFQKETWHLIDYIVSIVILVTIYFDWNKTKLDRVVNKLNENPELKTGSEYVLEKIKSLGEEIEAQNYHKDDVRNYFYGMLQTTLVSYARGYLFLELSRNVKNNELLFPKDLISFRQYDLIKKTALEFKNEVSYLSHHHQNLLIGSWSIFELLITILCESLLETNIKQTLLTHKFDDVVKKLKIPDDPEIRAKFSEKKLTHVPITRKYSELFKLFKGKYSRNESTDKQFLEFYRDLRNTIHTNYIFFGSAPKEFKFKEITFNFVPNEVIKYGDPAPLSPKLYIELIIELKDITTAILESINHKELIPYPDLNAQNF